MKTFSFGCVIVMGLQSQYYFLLLQNNLTLCLVRGKNRKLNDPVSEHQNYANVFLVNIINKPRILYKLIMQTIPNFQQLVQR